MKFSQAMAEYEKGRDVRRKCWEDDYKLGDFDGLLVEDIKATDWELVPEEKKKVKKYLWARKIDHIWILQTEMMTSPRGLSSEKYRKVQPEIFIEVDE